MYACDCNYILIQKSIADLPLKFFLQPWIFTDVTLVLYPLQVLADKVNIPCRVVKGCKYCKSDDASSCLVRFGLERYFASEDLGLEPFNAWTLNHFSRYTASPLIIVLIIYGQWWLILMCIWNIYLILPVILISLIGWLNLPCVMYSTIVNFILQGVLGWFN